MSHIAYLRILYLKGNSYNLTIAFYYSKYNFKMNYSHNSSNVSSIYPGVLIIFIKVPIVNSGQ